MLRAFRLSHFAAPRMLWHELPASNCYDVEDSQWHNIRLEEKNSQCWPQENGPGPDERTRRVAYLGALLRLTTGEKPLLGRGNRLWTMAGRSYAMAVIDRIDGWTNGENEDAACVEPWRATCCMLLDPYKRGGNLKLGESKEKDCVDVEREPALPLSGISMYWSQISSWHYMKTKFWRSWVMTLRFLVYGNAVY